MSVGSVVARCGASKVTVLAGASWAAWRRQIGAKQPRTRRRKLQWWQREAMGVPSFSPPVPDPCSAFLLINPAAQTDQL